MNLWMTAIQAVVYSAVSITFGLLYKRALKRDRERLERIISGVEAVFGVINEPAKLTVKETIVDTIQQYRKAIAAGIGVLVTGILTWLASDGVLASLLEPIVPDAYKPLIGVLAGGIATIVAVIRTTNYPSTVTTADMEAASPAIERVPVQTAPTSLVQLQSVPELSYL